MSQSSTSVVLGVQGLGPPVGDGDLPYGCSRRGPSALSTPGIRLFPWASHLSYDGRSSHRPRGSGRSERQSVGRSLARIWDRRRPIFTKYVGAEGAAGELQGTRGRAARWRRGRRPVTAATRHGRGVAAGRPTTQGGGRGVRPIQLPPAVEKASARDLSSRLLRREHTLPDRTSREEGAGKGNRRREVQTSVVRIHPRFRPSDTTRSPPPSTSLPPSLLPPPFLP